MTTNHLRYLVLTVLGPILHIEQKKAALRRVEMELDEADEMVRPLVFRSGWPTHIFPNDDTKDLANGD